MLSPFGDAHSQHEGLGLVRVYFVYTYRRARAFGGCMPSMGVKVQAKPSEERSQNKFGRNLFGSLNKFANSIETLAPETHLKLV